MKIYDELKWRGLIKDVSSPEIEEKLNNGGMTFYIGTDPTGDSMHIGHFSSFLISKRLKDAGHNPILLVGGATGLIGDPKPDAERAMITKEEVEHNFNCLKKQAENKQDRIFQPFRRQKIAGHNNGQKVIQKRNTRKKHNRSFYKMGSGSSTAHSSVKLQSPVCRHRHFGTRPHRIGRFCPSRNPA